MTDNEKLIEEAETAILKGWKERANSPDGTGIAESAARSAFRVFVRYMEGEISSFQRIAGVLYRDKALDETTVTPTAHEVTSDEREALARIVADGNEPWNIDYQAADAILAAGFRRTEVPEPSVEHQEHADARRVETMTLISHVQPDDEGWAKTLSDYRAAGWEGDEPDDHERMFWEAGFKQGVVALRAAGGVR